MRGMMKKELLEALEDASNFDDDEIQGFSIVVIGKEDVFMDSMYDDSPDLLLKILEGIMVHLDITREKND